MAEMLDVLGVLILRPLDKATVTEGPCGIERPNLVAADAEATPRAGLVLGSNPLLGSTALDHFPENVAGALVLMGLASFRQESGKFPRLTVVDLGQIHRGHE